VRLHKNVVRLTDCKKLCTASERCTALVHNKYKECHLKSEKGQVKPDSRIHETVACLIRRPADVRDHDWHRASNNSSLLAARLRLLYSCIADRGYTGDALQSDADVPALMDCMTLCSATPNCTAVEYNKTKNCLLKKAPGHAIPRDPEQRTVLCMQREFKSNGLRRGRQ